MTIVKNDLYDYYGFSIYQDEDNFKFSLDSILLAEFVDIDKKSNNIVDLCTGNAPVPLILSTKTEKKIYGVELQKSIADLAKMSIKEDKLEDRIEIINDNIKNISNYFDAESVDIVTCNPPYFKVSNNSSLINENRIKAIARHELEMNLEDVMISARYLLKNKAPLYIVHRCDRLEELIVYLNKYRFGIKKIQFIYSNVRKEANMVLIKAIKNGNCGSLKVSPPMDISNMVSFKGIFNEVK
jgi:tRNA1(Val) A37 N6-methylase TrmN6